MSDKKKIILFGLFLLIFFALMQVEKAFERAELDSLGRVYSTAVVRELQTRGSFYIIEFDYKEKSVRCSSTGLGEWASWKHLKNLEFWRADIGDRVYILFPKGKPERAELYLDFDVPPNLPEPPPEGWTLEEIQALDPNFKPEGIIDWW